MFLSHLQSLATDPLPISSLVAKISLLSHSAPRKIQCAQSTFLSDFLWQHKSQLVLMSASCYSTPFSEAIPRSPSCFSELCLGAGEGEGIDSGVSFRHIMWAKSRNPNSAFTNFLWGKKRAIWRGLQLLPRRESNRSTGQNPGVGKREPSRPWRLLLVGGKQGHDPEFGIKLNVLVFLLLLYYMHIIYPNKRVIC